MASDALYLRAGELLAYATTLVPGIQRAYVALAQPALDCPDQLTVHVPGLARQAAGQAPLADYAHGLAIQEAATNVATYVVTIVRCIPRSGGDGSPPLASEYDVASGALLADLWLLWKGIPEGIRSDLVWAPCEQVVLGPAVAIPEQGGFAGWQIPVTAEVYDGG